jgi:hypothetical protein
MWFHGRRKKTAVRREQVDGADSLQSQLNCRIMPMNDDDRATNMIRFFGAIGGFLGGALSGVILLIFYIVVAGSDFGLSNIWPGSLAGALIGAVFGFFYPRIVKAFIVIFTYFP